MSHDSPAPSTDRSAPADTVIVRMVMPDRWLEQVEALPVSTPVREVKAIGLRAMLQRSTDDPSDYYEQARELAVANAAAKAEKLAEVAGVKLGKPTYISESTYVPSPIYRQDMIAKVEEAAAVETPISPGEMEITLNVQMAYGID